MYSPFFSNPGSSTNHAFPFFRIVLFPLMKRTVNTLNFATHLPQNSALDMEINCLGNTLTNRCKNKTGCNKTYLNTLHMNLSAPVGLPVAPNHSNAPYAWVYPWIYPWVYTWVYILLYPWVCPWVCPWVPMGMPMGTENCARNIVSFNCRGRVRGNPYISSDF